VVIERRRMMCEFFKPSEVAERLGVSKHTVIRLIERGVLSGFRVGEQYRVRRDSVEKLINPNSERNEL
jgi:excisionase family DNA binding protein